MQEEGRRLKGGFRGLVITGDSDLIIIFKL
jgi:hypothetical protein